MPCMICSHPQRREIEDYLMTFDTPGFSMSLKEIAAKFGVGLQDLQVHSLMHAASMRVEDAPLPEGITSISADLKKSEASLLYTVAQDYLHTLTVAGAELRQRLKPSSRKDPENDTISLRPLPKEMVELYIGAGNNLRQTIGTIVDMNQKISEESDPALKALKGLIQAVKGGKGDVADD